MDTQTEIEIKKVMYRKRVIEAPLSSHEDEGGSILLNFHFKGEIKAGDVLDWQPVEPYVKVVDVLENRDHKGIFTNPELAIASFWRVQGRLLRR